MAIVFVVEDGTGKTNSNSYVTVAEFQQYWTNRGIDYTSTADATIQPWLIAATEFIDYYYKFAGEPSDFDTQALQWPRAYVRDSKGAEVADNEIPPELKAAVHRLGRLAQTNNDLFTLIEDNVKSKRVGPLSVVYKGSKSVSSAINIVNRLLYAYTLNKAAIRVVV